MSKLADRIAFIKASPYDAKWKKQQIAGVKATYARLNDRSAGHVGLRDITNSYWPAPNPNDLKDENPWTPDMHPKD